MDFSDALYKTETALLVRDMEKVQKATANPETATYGITSIVAQDYLANKYPKAKLSMFLSAADAMVALQNSKVDYVMTSRSIAGYMMKQDAALTVSQDNVINEACYIAIAQGREELKKRINTVLNQFQSDGTLNELNERWTNDGPDYYRTVEIPKATGKNGALKVALSPDVPPICFVQDGQYVGINVELVERIAHELDMTVEFSNMDFDALLPALQAGKVDLALSDINATSERKKLVDFTESYFDNPQVLVSRQKASPTAAQSSRVPVDTSRVGVMVGSTNELFAEEHYPKANIQKFNNYVDSSAALSAGKLDYAMMDYTTALRLIRSNKNLEIASDFLTDEKVCLGVNKNNPELYEKVSAALDRLIADGSVDKIAANWIRPDGSDYPPVKMPVKETAPVIKVAIISSREPTTFLLNSKYAGLDIELINKVLYELGYQAEYIDMELAAIPAAIESGRADMTLGMYNTPERAQKILFTKPFFSNPQVLLARKTTGAAEAVQGYTKLSQLSGKVIGSQTGTVSDILINGVIPNVTYSYYNNRTDQLEALKNRKVEAVPLDAPVAELAVAQNPSLAILPERVVEDHYGVSLQKDSPLTADVNAAIAKLKRDGTLAKMKEKWTSTDESDKTLPRLDYPGANGVLRVAHDSSAEPMCYVGADGKALGYDLELMLRIGEILDRKVKFTIVDFSGLIPMLQSGKADAAVGCMSITDERKQTVDMSDSYYDGGLYLVVRKAAGTAASVQGEDFFNSLKQSFIRTFITENRWKLVLDGLGVTALLSVFSGLFGTVLGFGICMLRRSKARVASIPAAAFIRLIQGTPIVVLLMILYYVVFGSMDISAILVAIVGFYVSEMMRTGIDAVDKGQIEASSAIGFNRIQTFCMITFPQAARHFLPVFKGEFISMVKMTSVVGYIAIQDLTKVSDIIRSRTLEAFFPLIATAVIYFLVANILTMLLSRIEVKLDPKRRSRAVKGVVMK